MIRISQPSDIDLVNLHRIAYQLEIVEIDQSLLAKVDAGRSKFVEMIAQGVPCYGVTTGLGNLLTMDLDETARKELSANLLRARAAAIGDPFPKSVARSMMVIRLVNFLTGLDGVTSNLCQFLVDRLNDDFVPWIPSLGHGMAADAIANCHAFQIFIGEGFVYGPDNQRQPASQALDARNLHAFELSDKEGLALLNGVTAAPAYAFDAHKMLVELLALANLVAALSIEGLAASKDAIEPAVGQASSEVGIGKVIESIRKHLNHSQIVPYKFQAPVSYRIIPQVHGAMHDALDALQQKIEYCLSDFTDNPLMDGGRFLSVGLFHNQHLVNQVEQVALNVAHLGCLSERRLHRLLNADNTGLSPQLAARPGLDAGLVVTQKASIDLSSRLRLLAQPLSLFTSETSAGQEDYMSMAIPAIARLYEMAGLTRAMLAYETLAGLCALAMREQSPGDGIAAVVEFFKTDIATLHQDRSPGPDVETILRHFESDAFAKLIH